VNELRLSAGAGFVVAICGNIVTMPGLPKVPAAARIKVLPPARPPANLTGFRGKQPVPSSLPRDHEPCRSAAVPGRSNTREPRRLAAGGDARTPRGRFMGRSWPPVSGPGSRKRRVAARASKTGSSA